MKSIRAVAMDCKLAVHLVLTTVVAWFALVLAVRGDTFASAHTFNTMAVLLSEAHWSLVFAVTAFVGVAGLLTNSVLDRMICVSLVSTMHGVVALCFIWANPFAFGLGPIVGAATLGIYIVMRRAHEGL